MWLDQIRARLFGSKSPPAILADTLATGSIHAPKVLILSGSKRNQNYYRDMELARQTRAVLIAEGYDFEAHNWDVARLCRDLMGGAPDWVFVNYVHSYTALLRGFDSINAPVFGFVGDHYNFTEKSPVALSKQAFFGGIPLAGMVSAYPHTNATVAHALGRPDLPFVDLPWAVDPAVFVDLKIKRRHDIACMGALTEGKYPFRRQVRAWLESQRVLKLYGKKRTKGPGGAQHDGGAFNLALNQCRSAFTCASSMQYLLMKYLEIPASGNLMFAEKIRDLSALGFVDEHHYLAVTPENFEERMIYYLKGDGRSEGERIARAGRDLVRSSHCWQHRIRLLLDTVAALLSPK